MAAFFEGTGDPMRRDISSLEHVLESGLSVAMYYGDFDYRCNCEFPPLSPPKAEEDGMKMSDGWLV